MSEKKTRIVTVGSVETKSGESGDRKWRRYGLKDEDDRFIGSTFSSTVGKFLQEHEGKRVEVDVEEKEGRDGVTLRDLLDAREPSASASAGGEAAGPTPAEKHTTIAREVALKAAVEYAASLEGPGQIGTEGVITIANKFLAYIEGRDA